MVCLCVLLSITVFMVGTSWFFLGVRNMAQAYMSSSGKERETALGKVKAGFKECTQSMCSLEVQLEQMMGSLEMRMKGTRTLYTRPLCHIFTILNI